jgi:hypothetical protein
MRRVFEPHDAQLRVMEDASRMKVLPCGRRLGKSNMEAHELIPYAFLAKQRANWLKAEGKRMEYWIVGPEYADSEKAFRVFYDKCSKLGMPFDKPGTYYSIQTGDMIVSLWDGAFILQGKSENRPNSLIGEALSGVILDEAAKMKQNTWDQLLRPTLADFGGWAIFTSTPEGKNWFHKLYMDSIQPNNEGWNGFRIPSWKNPYVFRSPTEDSHVKRMMNVMNEHPEKTSFEIIREEQLIIDPEIAQMANDLTIPMFQQEVAADFTDFVGKVFKEFDEETHTRLIRFNPAWETVAAVDYGYRNPSVWLLIQIGPWGEINVVDELYQDNLSPEEFAHEILRRQLLPDSCTEFFPDPASPGDTATLTNVFRKAGKRVQSRPHTGGELSNRLNLIRLALKNRVTDTELSSPQWKSHPTAQDRMRPRLMISTKCPNMIYEMGQYRYPEKRDEQIESSTKRFELPMKKDDHTPEALGRFLAGRYYDVSRQMGGGTKVSHAKFLRGLGKEKDYGNDPAGIGQRHTGKIRGTWLG